MLQEYLRKWRYKLAKGAQRRGAPTTLWYVDAFAGPWKSRDEGHADTSVAIGLAELNEAITHWKSQGLETVSAGAIFIEKRASAQSELAAHVESCRGEVRTHVLGGAFGDHVPRIESLIGDGDAAFILIDPTGWKGAELSHVSRLLKRPYHDVMINFMYDFINRAKSMRKHEWLEKQLEEFLGFDDPDQLAAMSEEELIETYRVSLKKKAGAAHALSLAIPQPTRNRTHFHLVVAGRSPEIVKVFRGVEEQVIGSEAASIRESAKLREGLDRDGQFGFAFGRDWIETTRREQIEQGLAKARRELREALAEGPVPYDAFWPGFLETAHITESKLRDEVHAMEREGLVRVANLGRRERRLKSGRGHVIEIAPPSRQGTWDF